MASNLACIGLGIEDEAGLVELLTRVQPDAIRLGTADGVDVFRWEDASGARLVFAIRGQELVEFVPSFAGRPGVNIGNLRALNHAIVAADITDDDGEQTSAIVFEVERRGAAVGDWSGRAAVTGFAPDAEFFASEQEFAASPRSLMDPEADPESDPPSGIAERGIPWPLRMAAGSFISYGVFADPADAEARARMNGIITAVEARTNALTGRRFLACRVESIGSEFDLVTVPSEGAEPMVGSVVAAEVFLIASIDELAFPTRKRGLFRRG